MLVSIFDTTITTAKAVTITTIQFHWSWVKNKNKNQKQNLKEDWLKEITTTAIKKIGRREVVFFLVLYVNECVSECYDIGEKRNNNVYVYMCGTWIIGNGAGISSSITLQ